MTWVTVQVKVHFKSRLALRFFTRAGALRRPGCTDTARPTMSTLPRPAAAPDTADWLPIGAFARQEGLTDFRTVFNTGAGVGQTVFHVHAHVLAGRSFGWPPG